MGQIEIDYMDVSYQVEYEYDKGMRGDGFLVPDDAPEIRITDICLVDHNQPVTPDGDMIYFIKEQIIELEENT